MGIWIATKTLQAIDEAIAADYGTKFRQLQGQVLPHIGDAYQADDGSHRSHLGASVIGQKCTRAIWYGWRWMLKRNPRGKKNEPSLKANSRMRRLWNRGHLEEGRFIAMLLMIGVEVYQQDANGKQFRISNLGGHFSGSGDGILHMVPDLPPGVPCLGEFKTHSDDSFDKLKSDGVQIAKPEHYAQMQEYMHHFGLLYALYLAVNKNNEELHAEIVMYDRPVAETFLDRAKSIVYAQSAPSRIRSASPGYFFCKSMCDYPELCYGAVEPDRNCRTCRYGYPMPTGNWECQSPVVQDLAAMQGWEDEIVLDKEAQMRGCDHYEVIEEVR